MITLGPLGLLPTTKLKPKDLGLLATIESLDIAREKSVLLKREAKLANDIDVVERELKRFFSLAILEKSPEHEFSPAHSVDLIWHEFILNTPKYVEFCNAVFGKYFHHAPEENPAQRRLAHAGLRAAYTKQVLTQHYGALDINVWGASARCDTIGICMVV